MATRLRLPPLAILVLAFAIFSFWAQWSKGIGMGLSPLQMAAMQPYALWQALIGVSTGSVFGVRAGVAIARVRDMHSQGTADALSWAMALRSLVPWVVAAFLSINGYHPTMVAAGWAVDAVRSVLPLAMAVDHSFMFGFAAGYFWGRNPQLGKHRDTPSV